MKNVTFEYLMFAALSAAIAAFCFYTMIFVILEQQSEGVWLFAAIGLLFSVLPAFALIRVLATRFELFARIDKAISPKPAEARDTHFGPHWMMLLGMIVIALLIVSLATTLIRSLF
jgi:uncharacterized membrane protein